MQKEDRRLDVLNCMVDNLMDIKSTRAFSKKVESIVTSNLAKMMEEDGRTHLDRYNDLTTNVDTAPKLKKKAPKRKAVEEDNTLVEPLTESEGSPRRSKRVRKAVPVVVVTPTKKKRTAEDEVSESLGLEPEEAAIAKNDGAILDEEIRNLTSVLAATGDRGTKELMILWKQECLRVGRKDLFLFALNGAVKALSGGTLGDVYLEHHASTLRSDAAEFSPPTPMKTSKVTLVDYSKPGPLFQLVARDSFHMMHVLLVSLVMHGEALPRWF